jgi:UDP-N-acetylmuramate--alanine ligase
VPQLGGGSGVGMGEHFIVEACEFDRSFLHLRPRCAVVLNVEEDHLDCYSGIDEIVDAFSEFANLVPEDGLIVANHADVQVSRAVGGSRSRVETFGFESDATWRAYNVEIDEGRYSFDVSYEGLRVLRTSMGIAGRHNVLNALSAIAVAWNAGASCESIDDGIRTFEGVDRRMSLRGQVGGVTVVDDYAHHPTEIRVTLEAVRQRYAPERTWVVFQPHQHSRTRILLDGFGRSFERADEVIIPDIYRSRDLDTDLLPGGSATLVERIRENGVRVQHIPTFGAIVDELAAVVRDGDLIVTMGAGNVGELADELVGRLQRKS